MSRLLPRNHEEFRTKEYWDKFFSERGNESFEWYGKYENMAGLIEGHLPKSSSILMVGCGNSEFSHDLYDAGYKTLRNQDYSDIVIEEMKAKNVVAGTKNTNKRPGMEWDLGDMTYMPEYADGSFDTVLDKGALDALLSVDSDKTRKQAVDMFNEITRVLKNSNTATYICITLAEGYILDTLVNYFLEAGGGDWEVEMSTFTADKPSPFRPLVFIFKKRLSKSKDSTASPSITCLVSSTGEQMVKVDGFFASETHLSSSALLKDRVKQVQEFAQKRFEMGSLKQGRDDVFEVWADAYSDVIPRFTLLVIDAVDERDSGAGHNSSKLSCAVFMVPMGRESAYEFSTTAGLEGIAKVANCKRLIAVRCNLPHVFPSDPALMQAELNPHMVPLFPTCKKEGEQVPYMAIGNDESWQRIASGTTEISGEYIVEEGDAEVENEEAGAKGTTRKRQKKMRRLRFLQNQHFVQTEVQLTTREEEEEEEEEEEDAPALVSSTDDGSRDVCLSVYLPSSSLREPPQVLRASRASASEGASVLSCMEGWSLPDVNQSMEGMCFDHSYIDSHHATALAVMSLCPHLLLHGGSSSDSDGHTTPQGLIVGLGGGAFPMFAQTYLPGAHHHVCDIDPGLLEIAVHYFGYVPKPHTSFVQREGVSLLQQLASANPAPAPAPAPALEGGCLDYIFLDVDSKDPSLGLSAPPQTFLAPATMEDMHTLLKPGGLLIVNVVARTTTLLEELKGKFTECFCGYGAGANDVLNQEEKASSAAVPAPAEEDDVRAMFRQATQGSSTENLSDAFSKLTQHDLAIDGSAEDALTGEDDIDDDDGEGKGGKGRYLGLREQKQAELVRANVALGTGGKRSGRVFMVCPSDDVVNLILVAVKGGGPRAVEGLGPGRDVVVHSGPLLDLSSDNEGAGGVRTNATPRDRIKERDTTIRAWLAVLGKADDPHCLRKYAVRIETVQEVREGRGKKE